jgi:hypothetical protein
MEGFVMQRYYLFGGMNMYPFGGVQDFRASVCADSVASARRKLDFSGCEWWHIAIIEQGVVRMIETGYIDKETELEGMR